ncbi:HEAT repeat domain-containing protein [Methylomarinum vadi]|uniref:HEAT repeat domain-containing protein n=1 Tax=Methylomarinum vadi TaxID=438855 RepID=UPI001362F5A6|nr:HEAT repeat domain-containing protein [Methylomarinum vadi]
MKKPYLYLCLIFVLACSSLRPHEPRIEGSEIEKIQAGHTSAKRVNVDLVSAFKKANSESIIDVQQLVKEYQQDYFESEDIDAKTDLLIAIAELDRINTVGFFIEALSDPEPEIRREAAIQLKQMVVNTEVREALIRSLDDRDADVLIEVIEALSDVKDKRIVDKFNDIGASHPDQMIREIALDYASKMGISE